MPRLFADKPLRTSQLPSFRAEHFPYSGPYPWLDLEKREEAIAAKIEQGELTSEEGELCRHWARDGYVILPRLIDAGTLDTVWSDYQEGIDAGRLRLPDESAGAGDPYPGRYLNPHKKIGSFCRILKHAGLTRAIRILMEREPRPLQTIASHKGSQQGIHSDSIHMTTYPLGYLTAAWIAFEDIDPDSGPLAFYPGSHRLPYVFSRDVGIAESDLQEKGYSTYQDRYEPYIRQLIAESGIEPNYFHARKGDVLIWHANLLHGGSPRRNLQLSRKALVCHYFVKGAFVYHDLAASRSKQQYLGTCLLRDRFGESLLHRG